MADPFVLAHVRRLPLVARLNPQQLEWVADVTQILRYGPGEVMYRQGDVPPGLFMFISGSGTLIQRGTDGVDRPFGQVATNEFINESALFSPIPSPMTLTIAETSIVMFLGTQQFQSALAYHPDLKTAITPTTPVPAQAAAAPSAPSTSTPQPKPLTPIRDNETVILQFHRHWWMVAGRAAWIIIAAILLWTACIILQSHLSQFPWAVIGLVGTVALGLYALYVYVEWRNDVFVITDRRVISTKQTIFTFNKEVNEVALDGIHEIAVTLPPIMDIVGRILGYGTLIIKTSGDASNMLLNQVADPKHIQETIFDQRKQYQSGLVQQQQNATRNAIKADLNKSLGISDSAPSSSSRDGGMTTYNPPGLFSLEYTNDKGETVYRKHHAIWMQHVLIPAMVVVAGIILLFLGVIGFLAPLGIILVGAVLVYVADWDWRNDLYVVGDQTITIIHKRPLFLQDQKDQVALAQVDNVVAEVRGFVNTLLQMGDVRLLLVGTEERNAKYFKQVYQPEAIQQEISRRQDHAEQAKRESEAAQQRQAIVQYLSVYHESVQGGQPTVPGTPQPQIPYANPAQPTAAPQPIYTQPLIAPAPLPYNYNNPTQPAASTPTPYNNPTQPITPTSYTSPAPTPTPFNSQPTVQSAPNIMPPPTLPELPPRVRDRSRPPSVPRARPDDQSSPRQ